MKGYSKKGLVIIAIIIGLIFSSIPTSSIYLKYDNYTNIKNNISVKSKEMDISFSAPQMKYNGNYVEINILEADSSILSPGKPVLPKSNQIMKFPLGTIIQNVQIIPSKVKQITLSKNVAIAPYPLMSFGKIGFIQNIFYEGLYKSSEAYPKEWFDYKTGGGLDDNDHVTFLSIQLFPVKYTQELNKIEYVEKIKIKVDYILPESPQTFPEVYDLLIITPSEYSANLDLLVEHKNNHGISTKLVTLEEINSSGRDKQEQIKYFIKESIENWGIKYVLLVGNKNKMPVRYTYPMSFFIYKFLSDETPTDLYYADIYDSKGNFCSWDSDNNNKFGENTLFYSDKVDLYPDVNIGRLCCANNTELYDVVNKIINYEDEVFGQEWFNNITICGGDTHPLWKDIYFLIYFRIWRNYFNFGDGKPAYEGEYIGNKISEILINFSSEKFYSSSTLPDSIYKNELTNENINNAINNGTGFVFFIGHGNPTTWGTYPPMFSSYIMPTPDGYTIDQIDNLSNENKYPIIIFDACSCGDFKNTDNPIAWEAVKLKSKGAIACFASTSLSFGLPGTWSEKSFNNLIDLGIAQAIADGKENVGDLLKSSINNYLNNAISDSAFKIFNIYIVQIQELFGDPTLKIGGYR